MSKNQTGFKIEPADVWILEVTPSIQNSKRSFCLPDSLPMGVTGFEPVTLRLSSACSNQLSYTPEAGSSKEPLPFVKEK